MPLIINRFGGRDTHRHRHTHRHTNTHIDDPYRTNFKKLGDSFLTVIQSTVISTKIISYYEAKTYLSYKLFTMYLTHDQLYN